MRLVTEFEEFLSLWNISRKNRYWGSKKITLEQEQEIIKKHDLEDFKRYNIYVLNDNYHFIVLDTKWAIDKDLYYDDEQEAPKITFEYFKAKNEVNRKYYKLESFRDMVPYFIKNYNGNDKEVCIQRFMRMTDYDSNLRWAKDKGLFIDFLTDDFIKEYNKIVEELNNLYDERLEKYFKKYRKNIYAVGYWVNR